jgi:hypothetical protein
MNRHALALFALLTATFAQAQVSLPLPACVDRAPLPLQMPAKPIGLPPALPAPAIAPPTSSSTNCGPAMLEANAVGGAAAYYCRQPGGAPVLYLYAVRWSAVTPAMVADFAALGLPGDNAERIRAMQATYQTSNVYDMCDVWGPMRERINAAMPVVDPQIYKTPTTGTLTLYTVANGVRSGIVAGRKAPAGAACDCNASKLAVGTLTYCALPAPASNSEVTLCQKAAP